MNDGLTPSSSDAADGLPGAVDDAGRFRAIIESAPTAIVLIDPNRRISLVNRRAEELFSFERRELIGQPIETLIPQRYRSAHPAHVRGFLDRPESRSMGSGRDLHGLRKDGGEVPVEIGLSPITTPEGTFTLASIIDITERKRAEERFRLVVEAAPSAMIMIDRQRCIMLVNQKTEDLFGYAREELLGQSIETLVPERFRASHPDHVDGFFGEPKVRSMGEGRALFGRRKDGVEVPVEIGLNPIDTPEGMCTLASIIDVTERRRAAERFRLVVEAAPSAMIMVDRNGHITLVNRKTEDMFGYARDALQGQHIDLLVPDRFRNHHAGFVRGFFADPKTRAMGAGRELFGRRIDGSEMSIEIGLNPIETGEGLFTLASIIDITERKRAQAAHEQLAAIVESSEDAIISKTLDGAITSWNHGAQQLFGYSAEEAIGRPIMMLVPERLIEEEMRIMEAIRRNERLDHFETLRRRKDGSEVDVSVRISPILDATGHVVGESKIARDITALKMRDAELHRSNAELEQFAYVASHDLQEPLRMVANYTELLAQRYRGQLDERANKYIHYASDGARRMQRLVADLLAFSRVGSQGKPLAPVDSRLVLTATVQSLQRLVRENGATIVFERLPVVHADEGQLHQLFQNLLSNAIKFRGEAPPHIAVAAVPRGPFWAFSVADNGIGIDMQFAERIFQMFQRLHELGKYEGSGIGLAIAKRIVERHGGTIRVESSPGQGTTFHFTLRAAAMPGTE